MCINVRRRGNRTWRNAIPLEGSNASAAVSFTLKPSAQPHTSAATRRAIRPEMVLKIRQLHLDRQRIAGTP